MGARIRKALEECDGDLGSVLTMMRSNRSRTWLLDCYPSLCLSTAMTCLN